MCGLSNAAALKEGTVANVRRAFLRSERSTRPTVLSGLFWFISGYFGIYVSRLLLCEYGRPSRAFRTLFIAPSRLAIFVSASHLAFGITVWLL